MPENGKRKKSTTPKYEQGDKVRVRPGVTDADYPDMPLGGSAGTILEVHDEGMYTIRWSQQTLDSIHPVFKKRCEKDGLDFGQYCLGDDDLQPDDGGSMRIERPEQITTKPLSPTSQDDRIRMIFELTSNDPLPEPDDDPLTTYYNYLAAGLSLPFKAKYSIETGPFHSKTHFITVLGLLDPDEFHADEYGLFCLARRDGKHIELPLAEVEAVNGKGNRRMVEDYSYWFVNW